MTTAELLQLLRASILNDRTDRVGGTSDYLWEDETLITFLNEAHRRFAVRGLVLRDGTTPAVTEITLVAGQRLYELHPSVIAIISMRREDQETDLNRVGHSLLGSYRTTSDSWADPQAYNGISPGPTLAFSTDEELSPDGNGSTSNVMLRVYPTPRVEEAGKKLKLRVVRKPIAMLSLAEPDGVPEIPEDHHIEMLDWAAYLALRIVDDDAGAPKRAAEFAQSFEAHVQEAKKLAMRKLFAPMPWGFGRGGFSWGS